MTDKPSKSATLKRRSFLALIGLSPLALFTKPAELKASPLTTLDQGNEIARSLMAQIARTNHGKAMAILKDGWLTDVLDTPENREKFHAIIVRPPNAHHKSSQTYRHLNTLDQVP